MAVLDSSALIPLARIGRLDLLDGVFLRLITTETVHSEVLQARQPGAAALSRFFDRVEVYPRRAEAKQIADMEDLLLADAALIDLASRLEEPILANDPALITLAGSHGIERWRVPAVLLAATRGGEISSTEAENLLLELAGAGVNLEPTVFARLYNDLRE